MDQPNTSQKINTHGIDLFLIGIVIFVAIISATILTYKVFIRERVKSSTEYRTAVFFSSNSQTIQDMLLAPLDSVKFRDLWIKEEHDFGICYVTFDLALKEGLQERLGVGLVKVADFWIVYEAVLGQGTPAPYRVVSTYDKILKLLELLEFQNVQMAQDLLEILKKEINDPNLSEYLSARVNALVGNDTYAVQILDDLRYRLDVGKIAAVFERAMIHFSKQEYTQAAGLFQEILKECDAIAETKGGYEESQGLFGDMPNDPFITLFDDQSVRAAAYQNLSLTYYHLKDYENALEMAEEAVDHSREIGSSVIFNSALFIKAMNFYALERFEQADQFFTQVIENPENSNLSQKAWAYYYRALIADQMKRFDDSLDFFEMAVNLDPFNFLIRKGAVLYLIERQATGDAQIALGMTLRGIQYNVEKAYFQDLASRLSKQLGVKDVGGEL